jgi:sulfoxide reductase catalytic subunit YedY
MLIKHPADIAPSEITSRDLYESRRDFIKAMGAGTLLAAGAGTGTLYTPAAQAAKFENLAKSPFSTSEKANSLKDITTYNNFYEFSTDKYLPAQLAGSMKTHPWTVSVEGLVKKTRTFGIE